MYVCIHSISIVAKIRKKHQQRMTAYQRRISERKRHGESEEGESMAYVISEENGVSSMKKSASKAAASAASKKMAAWRNRKAMAKWQHQAKIVKNESRNIENISIIESENESNARRKSENRKINEK